MAPCPRMGCRANLERTVTAMTHPMTRRQGSRGVGDEAHQGLHDAARERDAAAVVAEREACAVLADIEEEPATGSLPAEAIAQVLVGNTVYVEALVIASVRATKKAIATAIRSRTNV